MVKKRVIIEDFEAVEEKEVVKYGNSARIPMAKKSIGKKATVVIH